eukprot:scaffold6585_cov403-Prasinococcus_capsulatus_cf.AAC.5
MTSLHDYPKVSWCPSISQDFDKASDGVIQRVHAESFVQTLQDMMASPQVPSLTQLLVGEKMPINIDMSGPTYCTTLIVWVIGCMDAQGTYDAAVRSVGSCEDGPHKLASMAVVDSVMEEKGKSTTTGFSICRPPGPMGFCVFNKAAVCARYAQARVNSVAGFVSRAEKYGLSRVLIYDFDLHHGNGTQDIFYNDPDVLFISHHQAGIFPGTGDVMEVGEGAGAGATINIPLPGDSGSGRLSHCSENMGFPRCVRFAGEYAVQSIFDQVVVPAAQEFKAGYDGHWREDISGLQLQTSTFHRLGHGSKLVEILADELCDGRLAFLLEGGYEEASLGISVASTLHGILDMPFAGDNLDANKYLKDEPKDKVKALLNGIKAVHTLS